MDTQVSSLHSSPVKSLNSDSTEPTSFPIISLSSPPSADRRRRSVRFDQEPKLIAAPFSPDSSEESSSSQHCSTAPSRSSSSPPPHPIIDINPDLNSYKLQPSGSSHRNLHSPLSQTLDYYPDSFKTTNSSTERPPESNTRTKPRPRSYNLTSSSSSRFQFPPAAAATSSLPLVSTPSSHPSSPPSFQLNSTTTTTTTRILRPTKNTNPSSSASREPSSPNITSTSPPSTSVSPCSSCSSFSESEFKQHSSSCSHIHPPRHSREESSAAFLSHHHHHHYKHQHRRDTLRNHQEDSYSFPRRVSQATPPHSSSPERISRSTDTPRLSLSSHASILKHHHHHHSRHRSVGHPASISSSNNLAPSIFPTISRGPPDKAASSSPSSKPFRHSSSQPSSSLPLTIPPYSFPPVNPAQQQQQTAGPASPSMAARSNPPYLPAPPGADQAPQARLDSNPKPPSEQPHPDLATVRALLGPDITSWNFSDESLKAALVLRTQQEKTRQEYYKLELQRKTSEMISEAIRYNIAPSLIPILFNAPPIENLPEGQTLIDYIQQHQHGGSSNHQPSSSYAYPPQQPSTSRSQSTSQPSQPYSSSSNNPPFDALGLASSTSRERYPSPSRVPHHQRNLSLPQQPTIIPSEYQLRQQQPQPQQQTQQHSMAPQQSSQQSQHSKPQTTFRPGHHGAHHASMSAIPASQYTSPPRNPQGVMYPSSSRLSWQTNNPNAYFPPPQAAHPPNPGSPSTSVHHIIQFHHWQPNQQKSASAHSPKKDAPATLADDPGSSKRRRSLTGDRRDRSGSPTPSSKPHTSSSAIASANAHSRRRSMHSRHKSETSVLRGETLSKMSLYSNPSANTSSASLASLVQPTTASSINERLQTQPEHAKSDTLDNSGFNYLATVAAEESRKLKDPASADSKESSMTVEETSDNRRRHLDEPRTDSKVQFQLSPDFRYPAKPEGQQPQSVEIASTDKASSDANGSGEDVTMLDAPHQEQQRSHKQGVHFMISEPSSQAPVSPR